VLAAQNGWLSPLPPEGASAILHHDISKAAEMAAQQGVRSTDLQRHGVVDHVIPEYPDAADEPVAFCRRVGSALHHQLAALSRQNPDDRRAERACRFERLGEAGSDLAQAG
jgi:acetyl-CoA carboxylase carboxyl transferase subunit beta